MSAVPSEWSFSTEAVGPAAASITVPAPAANIRRVLTYVNARIQNIGGGFIQATLVVNDGVVTRLAWTLATDAAAGAVDIDGFAESVVIPGANGGPMNIFFPAGLSGAVRAQIFVRGYDL